MLVIKIIGNNLLSNWQIEYIPVSCSQQNVNRNLFFTFGYQLLSALVDAEELSHLRAVKALLKNKGVSSCFGS